MRVFDATMGIAGPHCTRLMALAGADVLKIESPAGDWCRAIGHALDGHGSYFATYNRGKRSIVLDLKTLPGRDAGARLAACCDIIVESFRPGVMARLGLGYAELAKKHPGLVYVSISGFGQVGAAAQRPAMDTLIQAASGWLDLTRDEAGSPVLMDLVAIDVLTGLYAFQAALLAILGRNLDGRGRHVDVSMAGAARSFLAPRLADEAIAPAGAPRRFDAPMGVWPTAEGWLALVVKDQPQFAQLCGLLRRSDLAADGRFASREARMSHAAELRSELAVALATADAAEWEALLTGAGIMAARVRTVREALDEGGTANPARRPGPRPAWAAATPTSGRPAFPLQIPTAPGRRGSASTRTRCSRRQGCGPCPDAHAGRDRRARFRDDHGGRCGFGDPRWTHAWPGRGLGWARMAAAGSHAPCGEALGTSPAERLSSTTK
ncbi:CaiB/BaiF CoA transferase family protein (plasmid) [Roseomonas sp. CCTCC AB2023176]|uniref:CaiB/BaiF CoA transferase family protein n=1 Tax=Roseomonas sp. CCTCC AB2023176 TaxID=3342640 RepID=UPI0035D99C8B